MEEENREKEKKITVGKEHFPGAGPGLLAVQQFVPVRCS
jgi:hypothetical protein